MKRTLTMAALIGAFLGAGAGVAGPTSDGHPLNRPGMQGRQGNGSQVGSRGGSRFPAPRGVGAAGPTFLPSGFGGVGGPRPAVGRTPVRVPTVLPNQPAGAFDRGVEGDVFVGSRGGLLEDGFVRLPGGGVVPIERRRPVILFGGRGLYPGGVIVRPGESARELLARGYGYERLETIQVIGPTDPRLWPLWAGRSAREVMRRPSLNQPDVPVQADAAAPMDAATARALGLVVLPPAVFARSAGLSPGVEWDDALSRGVEMLGFGETDEAVDALRSRVEGEPGDFAARRLLGLAQMESGDTATGVWHVLEAYRGDPSLAGRAVGLDLLTSARGARGDRARELLRDAVKMAHRDGGAGPWLVAVVMAQAEGRDRVASGMLERAVEAGLDPMIASGFGF